MQKWVNILFVEDEKMLRLFADEAFRFEGLSAKMAANGCEALEYLRQVLAENGIMPRVIFLDILMPCMDGHQLYETLAVEPFIYQMQSTTVVITSAAQEALAMPQGRLLTKVLYKPYEVGALVDAVRNVAPELFEPISQG